MKGINLPLQTPQSQIGRYKVSCQHPEEVLKGS